MPPRRRRASGRSARLADALSAAIADEARRLEAIDSPVEVIRSVGDTFAALDDELEQLAGARLRAIAHLRREGWTYERIQEATGLSKARVAQLSRLAKEL